MRQIVIADTNEDGTLSREAFLFSSAHEGMDALTASRGPLTLEEVIGRRENNFGQPQVIQGLSHVTRREVEIGGDVNDGPAPSSTYYCPREGGEWTPIEEASPEVQARAAHLRDTLEAVGVL